DAVNPALTGTKAAVRYRFTLAAGETQTIQLRLKQISPNEPSTSPFADSDACFSQRRAEADLFYDDLTPSCLSNEHKAIQRQALAGMLWNKQFYHYDVEEWIEGD